MESWIWVGLEEAVESSLEIWGRVRVPSRRRRSSRGRPVMPTWRWGGWGVGAGVGGVGGGGGGGGGEGGEVEGVVACELEDHLAEVCGDLRLGEGLDGFEGEGGGVGAAEFG